LAINGSRPASRFVKVRADGDCISFCNNLVDLKTSILKDLMTITEVCDVLRETLIRLSRPA
jgi:hypothetical protein